MAKTIFNKDPEKYILALAAALKKMPQFSVPEWIHFTKTGTSRERPPVSEDFWFVRAASILRQIYIKGVVGVGRLRTKYGSRKDRGGRPDKFKKAGGKIIRMILQQAESAGLLEKMEGRQHGRRLTASGRDFLDSINVPENLGIDLSTAVISNVPKTEEESEETIEENMGDEE